MLDDPSLELRRDAVARLLTAAEKSTSDGKKDEGLATYRKALVSARDLDQLKIITEALQKLGQSVDLRSPFWLRARLAIDRTVRQSPRQRL